MAKTGAHKALVWLTMAILASCATPEAPPPAPPPPRPVIAAPPPPPPEPVREPDTCRRAEHERLEGRNRSEIPVFVEPSRVRVTCATCPMTMDHNPARLNVLFNETTGVIEQVRCG